MLKWLIYAKHWKASTGHTYRSRTDEAQVESLSQSVLKEDEERKTEKQSLLQSFLRYTQTQ